MITKAQVLALVPELRRQGITSAWQVEERAEKLAKQIDRYCERGGRKPRISTPPYDETRDLKRAVAILTRHLVSPEKALGLGLKAVADVFESWPSQWSVTGAQLQSAWSKGFFQKCKERETSAKAAEDLCALLNIAPDMQFDRDQLEALFSRERSDEVMAILRKVSGGRGYSSADPLLMIADQLGMRPDIATLGTFETPFWTVGMDIPVHDALGDWTVSLVTWRGALVERALQANPNVDAHAMVDDLFTLLGVGGKAYVIADDVLPATGSKRADVQALLDRYGFALKPGDEIRDIGGPPRAPCLLPEVWLKSDKLETPITQNWAASFFADGERPRSKDDPWTYSAKKVQATLAEIFVQDKEPHWGLSVDKLEALRAATEVLAALGVTALDWNDEITAEHFEKLTVGPSRDAVAEILERYGTTTAFQTSFGGPSFPMTPEMLALIISGEARVGFAFADLQAPLAETARTKSARKGAWTESY